MLRRLAAEQPGNKNQETTVKAVLAALALRQLPLQLAKGLGPNVIFHNKKQQINKFVLPEPSANSSSPRPNLSGGPPPRSPLNRQGSHPTFETFYQNHSSTHGSEVARLRGLILIPVAFEHAVQVPNGPRLVAHHFGSWIQAVGAVEGCQFRLQGINARRRRLTLRSGNHIAPQSWESRHHLLSPALPSLASPRIASQGSALVHARSNRCPILCATQQMLRCLPQHFQPPVAQQGLETPWSFHLLFCSQNPLRRQAVLSKLHAKQTLQKQDNELGAEKTITSGWPCRK